MCSLRNKWNIKNISRLDVRLVSWKQPDKNWFAFGWSTVSLYFRITVSSCTSSFSLLTGNINSLLQTCLVGRPNPLPCNLMIDKHALGFIYLFFSWVQPLRQPDSIQTGTMEIFPPKSEIFKMAMTEKHSTRFNKNQNKTKLWKDFGG